METLVGLGDSDVAVVVLILLIRFLHGRKGRVSFRNEGRVAHISLVFREMWDTTALSL